MGWLQMTQGTFWLSMTAAFPCSTIRNLMLILKSKFLQDIDLFVRYRTKCSPDPARSTEDILRVSNEKVRLGPWERKQAVATSC